MIITEPTVTGNAIMLAGFMSAKLRDGKHPGPYHVVDVDAVAAAVTIEHERNGNTYRVSVVQIGGVE